MLTGTTILIVEDEALVADDLACAVEAADGKVMGPFETVAEALAIATRASPSGAILDANLLDHDVTPLALLLLARNIPFIIHTGAGLPAELKAEHPDLPVVLKPMPTKLVLARLAGTMGRTIN